VEARHATTTVTIYRIRRRPTVPEPVIRLRGVRYDRHRQSVLPTPSWRRFGMAACRRTVYMWSRANSAVREFNLAMFAPVIKSSDVVKHYRRWPTRNDRWPQSSAAEHWPDRFLVAAGVCGRLYTETREVEGTRMRSVSNTRLFDNGDEDVGDHFSSAGWAYTQWTIKNVTFYFWL